MAKILIVDDEPRIRDLIREHLQYAGFTCEEAGDGTAALSVLSQGGIDLVILDIMMPFMDGMTCLREMRTRKIITPVIMLTARSEEYDKLTGWRAAPMTMSSSRSPRGSWSPVSRPCWPARCPSPPRPPELYLRRFVHRHGQPQRKGGRAGGVVDPEGV